MQIKKYDIVLADFNPKKGHTQSGIRPCVVIQGNSFNNYSATTIVIPLTTKKIKIFPSEFLIHPSKTNGLKENSRFLGSQIITLDKEFFIKKLGQLEKKHHPQVHEALSTALDLDDIFS